MAGAQLSPYASGTDSNFAGSPAVQSSAQSAPGTSGHQRTYQACIPCRRRKVRCDLGSVDNPHPPPCSRCRRESKDCFFSSTRRKKRGDKDDVEEEETAELTAKAGRKRLRTAEPGEEAYEEGIERPRTPGGSIGRPQPLQRPGSIKQQPFGEEDFQASEQTTAILQGAEVHGGHDALKVLMEAAGIRAGRTSSTSAGRPSFHGISPATLPPTTSPIASRMPMMSAPRGQPWSNKPSQGVGVMPSIDQISVETLSYKNAIAAWSRYRFVRSGWFTAKEGIAYVLYFCKYLSPLTPITLPDFADFESHARLLEEEPMLVLTVLLIASRHMPLEGPGATSRPYTIHQKLWEYLKGMIDRVTWGQEQFGGGFCGAGAQPGCDVNPLTRKGLRTLGTVESLMLLTEWHPRAMHFPPDEADDELMMPEMGFTTPDETTEEGKGIGGQRMDSWLEPCWRSDRMCWMLLGMAMALAFEIGVFDKSEWQRHAITPNGQPMSAEEMQSYDKRRGNVRDLLLIYVTMTSGRLGLTSMLPNNYSKPEDSELYKTQMGEHTSIQETVLQFWLRIAAIMREGNKKIFANKAFTRDLIKNGSYKAALEQFRQPLAQWRRDFDECAVIPEFMRHILLIEFEYSRVYLNALSLQAVAERCANDIPQINDPPMDLSRASAITTNGIRTDIAITPQTLHKWLGGDRVYMNEVRDAACNLLTVVIKGLCPGQYLRHAPVRSYFRIISVAIMLLKSFSLGASEADIADSLKLMDQTVAALRNCIVDDVHVASRFADLLDVLIQNLKPRLKRVSDGTGRSRKQSVRTTPVSNAEASNIAAPQPAYYSGATNMAQSWGYGSNDILNGVTDDSYDINQSYSVMPPPTFGMQSSNGSGQIPGTHASNYASTFATDGPGFSDAQYTNDIDQSWYALPLDPLLGLAGADVDQTMYGPTVGGQDMLELLINDQRSYQ